MTFQGMMVIVWKMNVKFLRYQAKGTVILTAVFRYSYFLE